MFEAALEGYAVAWEKRELRGAVRQAFKRSKAVHRRDLTNRVHLLMDVERRQPRGPLVDVGDAVAELLAHMIERACH